MSAWGRRRSIWQGIGRLLRFRADGLNEFGDTPQAFVNSLAPLLAFPLVSGALTLFSGAGHDALANILVSIIALLAPAVLSHFFAVLWRREALWLRYAVAFNWCEAAVTLTAVFLLVVLAGRVAANYTVWSGVLAVVAVLLAYWLVLHGFLARRALRISVLRAVLLVIVVNIGTGFLVRGPVLLLSLAYLARGG